MISKYEYAHVAQCSYRVRGQPWGAHLFLPTGVPGIRLELLGIHGAFTC